MRKKIEIYKLLDTTEIFYLLVFYMFLKNFPYPLIAIYVMIGWSLVLLRLRVIMLCDSSIWTYHHSIYVYYTLLWIKLFLRKIQFLSNFSILETFEPVLYKLQNFGSLCFYIIHSLSFCYQTFGFANVGLVKRIS